MSEQDRLAEAESDAKVLRVFLGAAERERDEARRALDQREELLESERAAHEETRRRLEAERADAESRFDTLAKERHRLGSILSDAGFTSADLADRNLCVRRIVDRAEQAEAALEQARRELAAMREAAEGLRLEFDQRMLREALDMFDDLLAPFLSEEAPSRPASEPAQVECVGCGELVPSGNSHYVVSIMGPTREKCAVCGHFTPCPIHQPEPPASVAEQAQLGTCHCCSRPHPECHMDSWVPLPAPTPQTGEGR